MNCRKVRRYVELYLAYRKGLAEEKLLPFAVHDLEAHLAVCPSCRLLFKEQELLNEALDGPAEVVPPWDLTAEIMQKVAAGGYVCGQRAGEREAGSSFPWHLPRIGFLFGGKVTNVWLDFAFAAVAVMAFVVILDLVLATCAPGLQFWAIGSGKVNAAGLAAYTVEGGKVVGWAGAFLPRLFAEGSEFMMRVSRFIGGGF